MLAHLKKNFCHGDTIPMWTYMHLLSTVALTLTVGNLCIFNETSNQSQEFPGYPSFIWTGMVNIFWRLRFLFGASSELLCVKLPEVLEIPMQQIICGDKWIESEKIGKFFNTDLSSNTDLWQSNEDTFQSQLKTGFADFCLQVPLFGSALICKCPYFQVTLFSSALICK